MGRVQSDIAAGEAGPWICFFVLIAFNAIVYFINEKNVFNRCCHCNRGAFLAVTNRAAKVPTNTRPESFFAWDLLDAKHLASGRHVPAAVLLAYRLFCVVVFAFTLLWQGFGPKKLRYNFKDDFMTFFTNWTYVGFALSSLLGSAVAAKGLRKDEDISTNEWMSPVPPAQPYTLLDKAFHFVYMAITPSSGALSIFYWLAVYDGSAVTVDTVLKHGTSFGLLAFDLLLSRMAVVTYHIAIPIWYISAYTIYLWVHYDVSGKWLYKALDWTEPGKSAFYVAMIILLLVVAAAMYVLAGLREFFITGKCCCMCGCCSGCGQCCEPEAEDEAEAGYRGSMLPEHKAPGQQQFVSR